MTSAATDSRALPPLRDLIARHRLDADKSLGQHFLLDLNLCARIARTAGDVTVGTTIEIGPGPGGLTRALLEAGAQVIAIEKDTRCLPILAELGGAYPGRLTVVTGDAMTINCATLGAPPRRIVANLPYNVATELLLQWLSDIGGFESLTLMFQLEVAERLAAEPSTKAYGRLSIMTQWLCEVSLAFERQSARLHAAAESGFHGGLVAATTAAPRRRRPQNLGARSPPPPLRPTPQNAATEFESAGERQHRVRRRHRALRRRRHRSNSACGDFDGATVLHAGECCG